MALGHFGEWMQGGLGSDLALVTVVCPPMAVYARRLADGPLRLSGPGARAVPLDRAVRLAHALDVAPQTAGHIVLTGAAPPGGGAGASTAGLVALARIWLAQSHPPKTNQEALPARIARACLLAEGASDPVMYPSPDHLLWAPRTGRVLAPLPAPLPAVTVLGGFWGQGQVTDVADTRFPDIAPLWADVRRGPLCPARLAGLATQSARACTDLRGPQNDPTDGLARDLGALGYLRAHTGSARGMIFAPGAAPVHGVAALTEAGLTGVFSFATGGT
ncbi:MAG: propanediol utilization protein [Paracoccaceae bacterium]